MVAAATRARGKGVQAIRFGSTIGRRVLLFAADTPVKYYA